MDHGPSSPQPTCARTASLAPPHSLQTSSLSHLHTKLTRHLHPLALNSWKFDNDDCFPPQLRTAIDWFYNQFTNKKKRETVWSTLQKPLENSWRKIPPLRIDFKLTITIFQTHQLHQSPSPNLVPTAPIRLNQKTLEPLQFLTLDHYPMNPENLLGIPQLIKKYTRPR